MDVVHDQSKRESVYTNFTIGGTMNCDRSYSTLQITLNVDGIKELSNAKNLALIS